jgi:hypothetical protein
MFSGRKAASEGRVVGTAIARAAREARTKTTDFMLKVVMMVA